MKKILVIIILFCFVTNFSFADNRNSKKTLYIIKRLNSKAESLGYKVGDIFIDNFNKNKLKTNNYVPEAFNDDKINKCGYNLGKYDKYIKNYINNLDKKLIYRQFNEFETSAMGNFVLTEEINDKNILSSIKWGVVRFDETYCNTIKDYFDQWLKNENEKLSSIHKKEKQNVIIKEQKENEKYADIEAFMNDNSAWEKETKAFKAEAEREFKEAEAKRKKELEAKIQKEREARKKRLEERANRPPTLGEKQALISAKCWWFF